jgi:hypothetical protein
MSCFLYLLSRNVAASASLLYHLLMETNALREALNKSPDLR